MIKATGRYFCKYSKKKKWIHLNATLSFHTPMIEIPLYQYISLHTGDFLQSVDNIHVQMRFTYRKMLSPSMQLLDVDENGAVLIYRSSRSGFSKYLMGNILLLWKPWNERIPNWIGMWQLKKRTEKAYIRVNWIPFCSLIYAGCQDNFSRFRRKFTVWILN